MAAITMGSADAQRNDDLQELREEALGLIGLGLVFLILLFLGITAVDARLRQPAMVLILMPIIVAVSASRTRKLSLPLAATTVVAGLGLAIVVAVLIYLDRQVLYWFALLVIVTSVLLGDLAAFAVAGLGSGAVVVLGHVLAVNTDVIVDSTDVDAVLFLIWSTATLSWLATRPTRNALDWSWRSYLLALQRTRELQERQGELGRLAKSLNETCVRLEEMNEELERARRAAEEARRLKAEFAMAISHELRTPLNLVLGFSEMMLRPTDTLEGASSFRGLPESFRQGLEAIHRNADHISHLVNDVLDLSQIEAHRMALVKDWASPKEIAEQACTTVASLFDHLGLTLVVEVPPDLPLLYVDADRIRQVLINLLNNAARFTDHGQVTVRGSCDGQNVILSVTDTGAGIAPEDLPYVFGRFQQVGPKERRRGGSGLGLTICKQFAEMHGGDVRVESQLGRGSTFFLELPLCGNVVSAPLRRAATPRPTGELTIAVLDRETETVRLFQRYLDGYRVLHVGSPQDLVRLAAARSVHALVVNEQAALAGWRTVQEADPRLRNLPVFTCSLATTRRHANQLGVAECLVKPVTRQRLTAILRQHGRRARKVLVVEDDPEMAHLLASVARGACRRFRVRCVADGLEALTTLRAWRPDLLILDLGIPRLRGEEVLREMRADPDLGNLPVVVITGESIPEESVRTSVYSIGRANGLTVGEMMTCLRTNLDALLLPAVPDNVPERRASLLS